MRISCYPLQKGIELVIPAHLRDPDEEKYTPLPTPDVYIPPEPPTAVAQPGSSIAAAGELTQVLSPVPPSSKEPGPSQIDCYHIDRRDRVEQNLT